MNIVCKSYLKEFLKVFFILLFSMSLLLSIVGLVEKIDDFMPYKPPATFFIEYSLYSMPRYFFYLIPFVTLVTSLFIFSVGVRNREFLILSVCGGRLRAILKPFLVLGIIISIFGFFFGEFVQPEFTKKVNAMIEKITMKGKDSVKKEIFLRAKDGTIIKIGQYLSEQKKAKNVKLFIIKENFLIKKIDVQEAEVGEKYWTLKNGVIYDFSSGKVENFQLMNYPINLKISVATFKDIKKIEEFGVMELIQKRKELKRAGLSNPKIDTDISGRLSYNFVTFFMMVLGISLPLGAYEKFNFIFSKARGSGSGIITIGIGLIITILYWLVYSFFMFMGYSKILPPFISPWITPLIFGFVSIRLYYAIKE